jgi:hypothetical protein
MDKESQFNNWYKDVYQRRALPLMILMGISIIAMHIFEGLALTTQLNLFMWLTWTLAATGAVPCCMMIVLLIRLLRLTIKRRREEHEEKQQATM